MGPKERRARERELVRQEILDAASQLFVEQGYENVSMRKVAEKIEYSPAAIYSYFEDKSDVLFSLCEEVFAQLLDGFLEISRQTPEPVECLRRGLRAYVEFGLSHPNHYRLTFMTPLGQVPDLSARMEDSTGMKAFGVLGLMIQNCVTAGAFPETDLNLACEWVWAAIHGVTSLLIVKTKFPWTDRERLIDTVIATVIQGLKSP